MTPEEFDFLLIRQKEKILTLINNNRIREALYCLNLVKELWCTHEYQYKYEEIRERIRHYKMGNQKRLPNNLSDEPLVCEMCGRSIYDEQEIYGSRYDENVVLCCNECACNYDEYHESKYQE